MNILTGVHALDSDEILSVLLVFVLVSENDFGKRCATARIVHDVLHNSLDVSVDNNCKQMLEGGIQRDVLHPESTYPLRSAKSKVLKRAGETLFEVWALKIELAPRLCTIVEE